jgi:hypothetical protein
VTTLSPPRRSVRQHLVTARDGASCGIEISGRGPFVVFARIDFGGIPSGAVNGESRSNLRSGTRTTSLAPGERWLSSEQDVPSRSTAADAPPRSGEPRSGLAQWETALAYLR